MIDYGLKMVELNKTKTRILLISSQKQHYTICVYGVCGVDGDNMLNDRFNQI